MQTGGKADRWTGGRAGMSKRMGGHAGGWTPSKYPIRKPFLERGLHVYAKLLNAIFFHVRKLAAVEDVLDLLLAGARCFTNLITFSLR